MDATLRMRRTLIALLPWMATVAAGQATPQRAELDFLAREHPVTGGVRLQGELYLPISTLGDLGWPCSISGTDALIYVNDAPVRVPAKVIDGRLAVPMRAVVDQVGGVSEWSSDGSRLVVRGTVRKLEVRDGRVISDVTLGGKVAITSTDKPNRAIIDLIGVRLTNASQVDVASGCRAATYDEGRVRIVVETATRPRSGEQKLVPNWRFEWGAGKPEVAKPLTYEEFNPGSAVPEQSFDDLPLMPVPKNLGSQSSASVELMAMRVVSQNPRSALIALAISSPLPKPAQYARPEPQQLLLTLPGVRSAEDIKLETSLVKDWTAEDSPDGLLLRLNLTRPLGVEISQSDREVQLLLLVPEDQNGTIAGKVIVVDAGHGGNDNGARDPAKTTKEKDLNLAIATQLSRQLAQQGATVIMTRKTDVFIPLKERAEIANRNQADLFISIHINSNKTANSTSGTIMFFHGQDPISNLLADCLRAETGKLGKLKSIGSWSDTRIYDTGFAVLRYSRMPGVLVETGFINHAKDLAVMRSESFQESFAAALVKGVKVFFGDGK